MLEPPPNQASSQDSLEGKNDTVNKSLMKLLISKRSFMIDKTRFESVEKILGSICSNFIQDQYMKSGGLKYKKKQIFGKLIPYGSYKLETLGPTSDIDILLAAPKFVTKKIIFSDLYSLFEKCEEIQNLRKIESAYVPIIKFSMYGIKIDFTYSILNKDTIDETVNLEDDKILDGMKQKSIISLNAVRTNNMILNLVSDKCLFQCVVRFLKIWARERFISGNVFGYLGGINLAIIAVNTCLTTIEKTPDHVLLEIFYNLSQWNWPNPLKINDIKKGYLKSWSQTNSDDVMPIITPAYPAINSMRNATKSSLHLMMKEFNRAYKYTRKIVRGELNWDALLSPPHFFSDYRVYLQVSITAKTAEDFVLWRGVIEKELRILSKLIESVPGVRYAILFPHGFEEGQFCIKYYFALIKEPSHSSNSSSYSDSDTLTASPTSQNSPASKSSVYILIIEQVNAFLGTFLDHEARKPTMDLTTNFIDRKGLPQNVQVFGSAVQKTPQKDKYVPHPA